MRPGRGSSLIFALVVVAASAAAGLTTLSTAAAAASTITIGVDHGAPSWHGFEYTDFFPRSGTAVHQGDVVDFAWANNIAGYHNVAVLPAGVTPQDAWRQWPVVEPDPNDSAHPLQLNRVSNILGSQPPPGAPGGCGDAATPCTYSGTNNVINAAQGTDGQAHFFVRVNAAVGSRVNFVCLIHPGMAGSLTVVSPGTATTSAATLASRAESQFQTDTAGAFAAEHRADTALITPWQNGHRLIHMTAGTSAPHVEVAEMLPTVVHIHPGDAIVWNYSTGVDPHTVTFPKGTEEGEPISPACDASPNDTAFDPTAAGPPCGDPGRFELHLVTPPQGVTGILSPTTFGSSGLLLSAASHSPLPSSYAFSFPNAGVFTYQCLIHDHMEGIVRVDNAT